MEFYNTVTIIKTIDSDEFGDTHLVLLNGIHGETSKYGIAEPGGYFAIPEEEANKLLCQD